MWYAVLIGIVALIVILAVVIQNRPSAFLIERSAVISAAPEQVFDQVNDFRAWQAWSPWEKMDPDLKRDYGGAPAGVGATYGWVGNRKVGEGRMTIQQSDRPSRVVIKLEFLKPMTATNTATFTFTPTSGGTKVNWAMSGSHDCFAAKAFGLFCNLDKMVGRDFERGLANMKQVCEQTPAATGAMV